MTIEEIYEAHRNRCPLRYRHVNAFCCQIGQRMDSRSDASVPAARMAGMSVGTSARQTCAFEHCPMAFWLGVASATGLIGRNITSGDQS